ncbi:hypothetical protein [Mycetocola sp. 2940]|uniref:hypothetical protein n=1 Tax=Mycetocola sp. 2940 TaxID=3156452 RepID=UPI0033953C07
MADGVPKRADPEATRWYTEPAATGVILLGIVTVWLLLYSANAVRNNVPIAEPYTSGLDFAVRMVQAVAFLAAPITVWAVFVALGNLLVRKRGFGSRALVAFVVAAIPVAFFAVSSAIPYARSEGWQGMAMVGVAFSVLIPLGVLIAYCVAGGLLSLRGHPSPRDRPSSQDHSKPATPGNPRS